MTVKGLGGYFMRILDYFYTESGAARQLGVNRITIWRWIKKGKLNIQRVGGVVFIPREEIDLLSRGNKNA